MKYNIFFLSLFILVLLPVISSEDWGYNYLEGELNVAQAINYSEINVNNSQYFQDYTPTTLKDWIQGLFDSMK